MNFAKKLWMLAVCILLTGVLTATISTTSLAAEVTSAAGVVSTNWGTLNVRSEPGTHGAIVSKLSSGTPVTLIGKTGSWWRVEYDAGRFGYVSADYIRYTYGTYAVKVSTSGGNLNVRSGPGTSYALTGSVPNGRTVLVLSEGDGWYNILYNGTRIGYVSARYLNSMMAWPVPASAKINQYFGTHMGLDIGAYARGVSGDAVIAVQTGKVVYAGWLSGYGYVVYVNSVFNGKPIQTRYAHLSAAPLVSAGDTVGIGQKLGTMGSTGTSTGVHLHFEVRARNTWSTSISNGESTPINPFNYL